MQGPDARPQLPVPDFRVGRTVAITNARILTRPDSPPIDNGTVVVVNGRIAAVGPDAPVPSGCAILDAAGCAVAPGFWNAHVHFTEPAWAGAGQASAVSLEGRLAEMLTCHGFTSVIDTGSDPRSTFPLRARIASGEVAGPAIYSSGMGLYPPRGIPYYVRRDLPFYARWLLPQPRDRVSATRAVERSIARGADLVKLFTGSWVARGRVLPMPRAVAEAAVGAAHRQGRLAFAHPSNLEGTRIAIDSGVDVLAHAPDATEGMEDALLKELIARGIAMVPTLKMFQTTASSDPGYLRPIYEIVRRFRDLGGTLLFGTDVGYMRDYSTEGEFDALTQAGLSPKEILRTLTTGPAERFGLEHELGSIAPGKLGDLVILASDPLSDVRAFGQIRHTIRSGRRIWSAG